MPFADHHELSSAEELHPHALPEPYVSLSTHTVSTISEKRRFLNSGGSMLWAGGARPQDTGLARAGHHSVPQGRHKPTNGHCATRLQKGPIRRTSRSLSRPVQISTLSRVRRHGARTSAPSLRHQRPCCLYIPESTQGGGPRNERRPEADRH